jgi:K+-transporting ATPase ATPase C chain
MTSSHAAAPSISTPIGPRRSLGTSAIAFTRQTMAGARVLLALTLLLGVVYPLAVTAVGQVVMPWQANGSLLTAGGTHATSVGAGTATGGNAVVGSALVGQAFTGPQWFHPRPSVAGTGYDTLASGGSNLGPNSADLVKSVAERRAAVAAEEGVDPSSVPADALTASASGLDPDISPAYARLQVARVAAARNLPAEKVSALVESSIVGRTLGVLGDPRVNVLQLNLALTTMAP